MATPEAAAAAALGPLVWVRRRNGSWWPGRILKMEEVPPTTIVSPKSGTPVKLLGREDASVEWYNLEKSIRVKAFRCGEFDACIERAEASHIAPVKRREKYARREDAILHALELERELFGIKRLKPGVMMDNVSNLNSSLMENEVINWPSENYLETSLPADSIQFANNKSQMVVRRAPSTPEEVNLGNRSHVHMGRNSKPFSMEEAGSESLLSQASGLQDLGLRTAPAKKRDYQFIEWDSLQKPVDNHGAVLPCAAQRIDHARYASSDKKRRKNVHGVISEESPSKRRDRHKPLHKVTESSAKLSLFHSFQHGHDVGKIPVRGKRSRCIYLPADSNDSDHVGYSFKQMPTSYIRQDINHLYPDCLEEENPSSGFRPVYSDTSEKAYSENAMEEVATIIREPKTLLPDFIRHGSYSPIASEIHLHENTVEAAAEVGVSKWHMKGKRNIRSSVKSPINTMDPTTCNSADKVNCYLEGIPSKNKESGSDMRIIDHSSQQALGHGEYSKNEFRTRVEEDFEDQKTSFIHKESGSGMRVIDHSSQRALGHGEYSKNEFSIEEDFEDQKTSFIHKESGSGMRVIDHSSQRALGHGEYSKNEFSIEEDFEDQKTNLTQPIGFCNQRYPLTLKAARDQRSNFVDSDDDCHVTPQAGWEGHRPSRAARRTHWKDAAYSSPIYYDPLSDEMEPMLVDVDLKVRASYKGEHVPLVSLRSRLNGKAIIGHPVQVEILEDGSSSLLFYRHETSHYERTVPSPVWKTAKRTAIQRIPRSNRAPSALESEEYEPHPGRGSGFATKPPLKKAYFSRFGYQSRLAKKSTSHVSRSASGRFQSKLMKNASPSGQKIRTLSSLSAGQNCNNQSGDTVLNKDDCVLGEMIKPDETLALVTCVPAKVVFSRILEAVGRPPSSVAHRNQVTD